MKPGIKPKSRQTEFTNIRDTLTKHGEIECTTLSTKINQSKRVKFCFKFTIFWSHLNVWIKLGNKMKFWMSTNVNKAFQGHSKKNFSNPSNGFPLYAEPSTMNLNHDVLCLSTDTRNGLGAFSSSCSLPSIQLSRVQSLIIALSEKLTHN